MKKEALINLKEKGVVKKIIGLVAISTIGLMTVIGLTGCSNNTSVDKPKQDKAFVHEYEFLNNAYILIPNEKGEFILHKGDIYSYTTVDYNREAKYGSDKLTLDCGEEVYTDNYKAYIKNPKKAGHYVDYCKDCFDSKDLSK